MSSSAPNSHILFNSFSSSHLNPPLSSAPSPLFQPAFLGQQIVACIFHFLSPPGTSLIPSRISAPLQASQVTASLNSGWPHSRHQLPRNNARLLFMSTKSAPRKLPIRRQSARSNRNSPSQCRRQASSAKSIPRCVETMSNSGRLCGAPARLPVGHQRWEKSMVFSIHSDHTIGLPLT